MKSKRAKAGSAKSSLRLRSAAERGHTKTSQTWVDNALAGSFKPGSVARLRRIAIKARAGSRRVREMTKTEDMRDAIRGIHRGLDGMKAGKGVPSREALDRIRAKYMIPR